ncbi:MAG: hypothetical protein OEU32_00960 [Acidimicrobiia bacterium]|nr:hypothetical protein [Acidimicrobiia bacterium]
MASSRTTFEKLQRDRAKAAKAAAKRAKREERRTEAKEEQAAAEEPGPLVPEKESLDAAELLATVERLHKSYDNEEISFEEFEEAKAELMAMIQVD